MNSIVAEKTYIQNVLGVPYANLSQAYLRAETLLTNTSVVNFLLQKNSVAQPIITEQLLNLNDEFIITHFAVGIKHIASATPTDLEHLNARVYTFPNFTEFAVGTNNENVAALYNSNLSFTIDRKEYLPNFPVRSFLRVPTTQQINAPAAGEVADGYDNGLYGFYPSEPTRINGRQTLDINIDLGSAVNFAAASNSVYAVFEVRGYLIVNAKN
jgi:hypothetical protein